MAEASNAAALVAGDMLGEAAGRGFPLNEDVAEWVQQNTPAPSSLPAAEAEAQQEAETAPPADAEAEPEAVGLVDYRLIPDDELAELGDDEDDTPPVPLPAAEVDEDEDDYVDPEVAALRKQLAQAQNALKFQTDLRVKEGRKNWEQEAKRRYPLAAVGSIEAASKRAFMRQAAHSHNAIYQVVKPELDRLKESEASLRTKIEAEVQAKWGKPTTGPGQVPIEAAEAQRELEAARATGDLTKVVGVLRRRGR